MQITIEADIGKIEPRWVALDDIKFEVVSDKECTVLPPEADPNRPSTTPMTTKAPYLGIVRLHPETQICNIDSVIITIIK